MDKAVTRRRPGPGRARPEHGPRVTLNAAWAPCPPSGGCWRLCLHRASGSASLCRVSWRQAPPGRPPQSVRPDIPFPGVTGWRDV